MPEFFAKLLSLAIFLPRIALVVLALSAPVFAMPAIIGNTGSVIEHQQKKSNGVGFVLLVSLQR
jgi:hypothetical protein